MANGAFHIINTGYSFTIIHDIDGPDKLPPFRNPSVYQTAQTMFSSSYLVKKEVARGTRDRRGAGRIDNDSGSTTAMEESKVEMENRVARFQVD